MGRASFGVGEGPVYMDDVACRGNENSLTECMAINSAVHCGHDEDAGVICNGMSIITS